MKNKKYKKFIWQEIGGKFCLVYFSERCKIQCRVCGKWLIDDIMRKGKTFLKCKNCGESFLISDEMANQLFE